MLAPVMHSRAATDCCSMRLPCSLQRTEQLRAEWEERRRNGDKRGGDGDDRRGRDDKRGRDEYDDIDEEPRMYRKNERAPDRYAVLGALVTGEYID